MHAYRAINFITLTVRFKSFIQTYYHGKSDDLLNKPVRLTDANIKLSIPLSMCGAKTQYSQCKNSFASTLSALALNFPVFFFVYNSTS